MEFPLYTDYEDFSFRRPSQGPTFRSLSRTSESSTNRRSPNMPSVRKFTPPEDHQRSTLEKKKRLSLITSPTASAGPPTPPGSTNTLSPIDVRRYEVMLQESFRARKERRAWNFTPACQVERIQMSPNDFWKLYEALGAGEIDHRWPSISFNSHTSTAIIEWMPSGAHEPLASTFIEKFGVAKELLSPAIARQVKVVGGQKVGAFRGSYQSSMKEADVLFKYHPPNGPISYTCAIEVGFAERYEDLVEDVKLWIEGGHMRTVILIKVDEAPLYCSPTRALRDNEIEALDLPAIPDLNTSMVALENQTDRFGPLQIRGLTWVNKMYAFLEIWKPDGTTGEARQQGDRKYFVDADDEIAELDIKFSDLYPIGDVDGGNQRLPVTWERLRSDLEEGREELAVVRCCEMLIALKKRTDAIDDPDYID